LDILTVKNIGLALDGPVTPKKQRTRDLRSAVARVGRVARKAPEVMVKVSGSGKNSGQVLAHMTYITRNGKIEAENERGEKIEGLDDVKQAFREWGFSTAQASSRRRAQTVNIVLSMPEGTDPKAVLAAARAFAKERFSGNHQYLLVLHSTETDPDPKAPPHPHVHLSVKAQGFDLTWLKRSKADLQEWRETFAEKLRERGVEAEATPRRSRGVIAKARSQPMHHLAKTPRRSTVIREQVDELIREQSAPTASGSKSAAPWDEAIRARQNTVRQAYEELEQALRTTSDPQARRAATDLAAFLKDLPPMETQHDRRRRQLATMIAADRQASQQPLQEGPKSGPEGPIVGRDVPDQGRDK
jgi:hypothetical protein